MAAASKPLMLAARAILIAAVVACLAGPWLFDAISLTVLTEFFVVLTLALMWNLLAGYADIISVGQQGFVGVGAYAFFGFTALAHLSVWLAVPLAALTTLVIAVPVMAVIFRLRTAYLAVGTWVAADVLMLIAGKLPGFGGGSGTSLPIPVIKQFGARLGERIDLFYAMSLGLALIAFVATWALLRSRVGLGLTAMRDNEEAAGSAGVDLVRTRILCFLWTAPFLGLAGVMTALEKLRVAPSASFNITDWTIDIIFIVVIGGIGSLEGPIIGAVVFFRPAPVARRLRRLVPDPARRDLDRRHPVRAARACGAPAADGACPTSCPRAMRRRRGRTRRSLWGAKRARPRPRPRLAEAPPRSERWRREWVLDVWSLLEFLGSRNEPFQSVTRGSKAVCH